MFFSYALGRVESTGPVRKKVAESRGEQQRAPTRHLGPPRVSADGDPEMFFSSSLGRITAGGVVETEPDREKVAESRGQQQRAGAKHLGPPQVSAGGDPHMFFSSSLGRITTGSVDATGPGRKKVAESRGQQQFLSAIVPRQTTF